MLQGWLNNEYSIHNECRANNAKPDHDDFVFGEWFIRVDSNVDDGINREWFRNELSVLHRCVSDIAAGNDLHGYRRIWTIGGKQSGGD